MSDDRPRRGPGDGAADRGQPPLVLLQAADLCLYGLAVAVVLVLTTAAASFALGAGWGGSKYLLFVIGFLLFGLGALGMRPKAAWKDDESQFVSGDGETRFQATIHAIPPLRWYDLAPDDRLSLAAKLFVGSLFVLGASFVMETFFGVRI